MNHKIAFLFLLIATRAFANDSVFENSSTFVQHEVGNISVIEYPKVSKEAFEIQLNNEPLFIKHGNDLAIFHSAAKQPMVMLIDENDDGVHDSITYDQYDSNGNLISTTIDRNFDGQSDFKMIIDNTGSKPSMSAFAWISNQWYQVHERGRDSNGLVIKEIFFNNNWVSIDMSNYPFKVGK